MNDKREDIEGIQQKFGQETQKSTLQKKMKIWPISIRKGA